MTDPFALRSAADQIRLQYDTKLAEADDKELAFQRMKAWVASGPAEAPHGQTPQSMLEQAEREQGGRRAALALLQGQLSDATTAVGAALDAGPPLFGAHSTEPIALLPVRIETTFVDAQTIRARIYPDDLHIDAFNPALTPDELTLARAYWASPGPQGWQHLLTQLSPARATWATHATRPGSPEPAVRDPRTRTAPTVGTLPSRWRFLGLVGGAVVVDTTGADLPHPLALGLTAADEELDNQHAAWLIDFGVAEAIGMAATLTLPGGVDHLDQLFVIGVQDAPATDAAQRLRTTVFGQAHLAGLGFLEPGTPTNNTPQSRSAWSSQGTPAPPSPVAPALIPGTAAAELSRALGFADGDFLADVPGANADGDLALAGMSFLTWPAMAGNLIADASIHHSVAGEEFVNKDVRPWVAIRDHLVEHVRSRGPLPTIRVGHQPYGVLPVTTVDEWRPSRAEGQDVPGSAGRVIVIAGYLPAFEAPVTVNQAVEIFRVWAAREPTSVDRQAWLAWALHNAALCASAAEQPDEAATLAAEAASCRDRVAGDPSGFDARGFSRQLLDLVAVLPATEADTIARHTGWLSMLAQSLIDVGVQLWNAPALPVEPSPRDRPRAYRQYRLALDISRELVARDPAAFGPAFLTWVHWPIVSCLQSDGKAPDFPALATEAATLSAEAAALAEQLGNRAARATALLDQGVSLWNIPAAAGEPYPARRAEAYPLYRTALDMIRELIGEDPATYTPTFITWVHWPVAACLQADGKAPDFPALATEAATLSAEAAALAEQLGNRAARATALLDQGVSLWNIPAAAGEPYPARRAEAYPLYRTALDMIRELIGEDPATYTPTFITWVHWPVAACLQADGKAPDFPALATEAATLSAEAAALAEQLGNRAARATALLDQGVSLWNIPAAAGEPYPARRAEAYPLYRTALDMIRELIGEDPATYTPTFITWVHWPVAACLQADGKAPDFPALATEAATLSAEAAALAEQLGNRAARATALLDQGVSLWNIPAAAGEPYPARRAEAYPLYRTALDMIRELIGEDPATYTPTFITWVHWPVAACMQADGTAPDFPALQVEAAALTAEAATLAEQHG